MFPWLQFKSPRENLQAYGQEMTRRQREAMPYQSGAVQAFGQGIRDELVDPGWGTLRTTEKLDTFKNIPRYDTVHEAPADYVSPWSVMAEGSANPALPPGSSGVDPAMAAQAVPGYPGVLTEQGAASVADASRGFAGGGGSGAPATPGGGSRSWSGHTGKLPPLQQADMAEYDRIARELETMGAAQVAQQQQGIDELKAQADAMRQREGDVDLSPLLALSDTWFGGNTQKGYTAPQTRDEREQGVLALEQYVQKSKQSLTDDQIGLLQNRLGLAEKRVASEERAIDRQAERESEERRHSESVAMRMMMAQQAADTKASFKDQETRQNMLKTPELQAIGGITDFNSVLNRYEQKVKDYGVNLVGIEKQELEGLFSELAVKYKEAKRLGALAGPDMNLVKGSIGKADDLGGWIKDKFAGGDGAGVLATLQQLKKTNESDFTRLDSYLDSTFQTPSTNDMKKTYRQFYAKSKSLPETTDVTQTKPLTRQEKIDRLKAIGGQ